MGTLASRVATRFLAANITVKEIGAELIVSGSYTEMSPFLSKLKSRGFYYNSADKTWRILLSKMTPQKRDNLNKLLGLRDLSPEENAKAEAAAEAKRVSEVARLKVLADRFDAEFAGAKHFTGFNLQRDVGTRFLVKGTTYEIQHDLKRLGGKWDDSSGAYQYDLRTADLDELKAVLSKQAQVNETRFKTTQALLGPDHKITWPTLGVTLQYTEREGFTIQGRTKPFAPTIRNIFGRPVWTTFWTVSSMKEGPDRFKKLISTLNDEEAKAVAAVAAQAQEAPSESRPAPKAPCRPNQKPGTCQKCQSWVEVGDGCIYQDYDDDTDRNVWVVVHKNPAVCEENKRKQREHTQKVREERMRKDTALKNIREWARSHGQTPPGNDHRPPGKQVYINNRDSVIYGGGEWVVIEPGESHFWYVKNNGHDGDDWSYNNVLTGGAGAIGVRAPLTPEVLEWVNVAAQGEN